MPNAIPDHGAQLIDSNRELLLAAKTAQANARKMVAYAKEAHAKAQRMRDRAAQMQQDTRGVRRAPLLGPQAREQELWTRKA